MKEQEPVCQEKWLLSSYDFNNGFWQDKRETLNQTFRRDERQFHLRSNSWEIYRSGVLIAKAQEAVFQESGPPVMIITPLTNINPEDKEALLASLKHYQAQREENLKL